MAGPGRPSVCAYLVTSPVRSAPRSGPQPTRRRRENGPVHTQIPYPYPDPGPNTGFPSPGIPRIGSHPLSLTRECPDAAPTPTLTPPRNIPWPLPRPPQSPHQRAPPLITVPAPLSVWAGSPGRPGSPTRGGTPAGAEGSPSGPGSDLMRRR